MKILENSEIYQLQADYVNGIGEHGSIHKKYAGILQQYKKLYAECPVFEATGLMNLYKANENHFKSEVIADIVLIALSVLGFVGWLLWFLISFIAATVKWFQIEMEKGSDDSAYNSDLGQYLDNNPVTFSSLFTEKSGKWFILPLVIVGFVVSALMSSYCGYGTISVNWAWVIYNIPLIIDLYKNVNAWKIAPKKAYDENKKRILKMQQAEAHLEELRKQLRLLLPELQNEYTEELNQALDEMNKSERKLVMKQYGVLPKHFWWEINPSQILEEQMMQESAHESFMTSHEIAAIKRTLGNEFKNAGANYAPMLSEQLTDKEINQIYQRNIQLVKDKGGVIFDFADCIKSANFVNEYEMVKDYEYAENSVMRAHKTDQWDSLGSDIEKARSSGVLTEGEYGSLRNRYDNLNSDVRGSINRKVEVGQHIETYNKLRIFAIYEWTGQALLIPDTNISGGYVLLDYRCRPEYEFENLEKLKSFRFITQIQADYVSGQQSVIANMQRMIIKSNIKSGQDHVKQKIDTAQVLGIISIALLMFFNIPMVPIAGIILGIISRKKGGGKLAVIGIILNIFIFIIWAFVFLLIVSH